MEDVKYPDNCTKVLNHGFVRLVDIMGNDASIVQAARVSYGDGTKTVQDDTGLIRYLLRHRHTTPFEMVEFKFHMRMPIFVARQWIRHRTASVNEYSGRYSEMPPLFYVPEPERITRQSTVNKQGCGDNLVDRPDVFSELFKREQCEAYANYQGNLEVDMSRELARINLPLSTYTEWYWKIDMHNLFHFLKLRLDSHAQYEIRVFAEAMAGYVKGRVPIAYQAFEDYVLNAVTFSAIEIKQFKDFYEKGSHGLNFTNKREEEEFVGKMKRVFDK